MLHMFSYNLSWASVFCRLRDTYGGVIEAESLYCSVTEAHSYEEKNNSRMLPEEMLKTYAV